MMVAQRGRVLHDEHQVLGDREKPGELIFYDVVVFFLWGGIDPRTQDSNSRPRPSEWRSGADGHPRSRPLHHTPRSLNPFDPVLLSLSGISRLFFRRKTKQQLLYSNFHYDGKEKNTEIKIDQ